MELASSSQLEVPDKLSVIRDSNLLLILATVACVYQGDIMPLFGIIAGSARDTLLHR